MLNYKGYIGHVSYDDEAEIFTGEVVNTRDVITFQSTDAKAIKNEMVASVDAHLAFCRKKGIEASKPYSGDFMIRTSPMNHGLFMAAAKQNRLSLNKWSEAALIEAAKHVLPDSELLKQ